MKSEFAAAREFVRGAARNKDLVYILSKGKTLIQQGIAHTSVIAVYKGKWADAVDTEWDSTAIAISRLPTEKAIIVGEDGDVAVYAGGKSAREKISPNPVMIRNARTIEGHVYTCGMKRQVYRRVDEARWSDMSAPFPEASEEVGFEAIDGYSSKEIYAVGWDGEIWQYDGVTWTPRKSPTASILSSVCCAPNGTVYAAGQQGVLLQGRNDAWQAITWDDEVSIDLWDLCWFKDKLYVAGDTTLFTLEEKSLVPVDFGGLEVSTCFSLTTAEGVLWSVGPADVASFDGTTWRRYD